MSDNTRGQNNNYGLALTDIVGRQAMATIFGELVVGVKEDDISVQFQYNNSTADVNIIAPTGTGEQTNNLSMIRVNSGAGVGSQTVFSRDAIRYRPGHESFAQFTARFDGAGVGVSQYIGIGDNTDRVCFGTNEGEFGVWFQEGGNAAIFTPQSAFNGDTLDGSKGEGNPSGFQIDKDKMNIFYPLFGWLGTAPLIWMVYGGKKLGWIVAHYQDSVNKIAEPHLQNPTLPMVCESTRTSGTGEAFIESSSWRGGSVAGTDQDNALRRFGTFILDVDATAATTGDSSHLLSLKSKTTFQGKTNHVKAIVDFIINVNNLNKDVVFKAYSTQDLIGLNPSFDPGYIDINTDNSIMQAGKSQDSAAINLDTTGLLPLDIGITKQNDLRVNSDVKGFDIYGGEEITFVVENPSSGTGTVDIQIDWNELF